MELPFTLKAANGEVSGAFHAEGKELQIENGKLDGNSFTWTVKRPRSEGGVMTYKMSGNLENGKIAGKASTELEGNEIKLEWTARKK